MDSFQYWYRSFCPATPTLRVRREEYAAIDAQKLGQGYGNGTREDPAAIAPCIDERGGDILKGGLV